MPRGGQRLGAGRKPGNAMTAKQTRFVAEYLIDLNATQAAIRAGYSANTAEQQAYENLRRPEIAQTVAVGKATQLEQAHLSAARVLEEYRRDGFSDIGALLDEAGRPKPLKDLPPDVRAAIASVKVTKKNLTVGDGVTEDVVELKLWDKTRALNDLEKHFALLVERVEVTNNDALLARLDAAKERNRNRGRD
jgi:phage terminase small subunit